MWVGTLSKIAAILIVASEFYLYYNIFEAIFEDILHTNTFIGDNNHKMLSLQDFPLFLWFLFLVPVVSSPLT